MFVENGGWKTVKSGFAIVLLDGLYFPNIVKVLKEDNKLYSTEETLVSVHHIIWWDGHGPQLTEAI